MSKPPFLTRNSTRANAGLAMSRFGPAVPVDPAAASVWHPPHPELANSGAPALAVPTGNPGAGASGAPVVVGVVVVVFPVVVVPPVEALGMTLVAFGTVSPTPISPFRPATV